METSVCKVKINYLLCVVCARVRVSACVCVRVSARACVFVCA